MIDPLALSLAGLTVATGGLVALEVEERRRHPLHRVELRFGRDVTAEAVVAVLDQVGASRSPRALTFELLADHNGVRYFVRGPRGALDQLRSSLRASVPSARVVPAASPEATWTVGQRAVLRGRLHVLRDDVAPVVAAALLASLQPLSAGELVTIRWCVSAGRPERVPGLALGVAVEPEDRRRLRAKNAGGVARAHGVIAVQAASSARAQQLLMRATNVLRSRSTAYGRLAFVPILKFRLKQLDQVGAGVRRGDRYATAELAGLLGWPIDAPLLPGLTLGTSPLLMPSPRIPRSGRVIGEATWPGSERPIAQPLLGAMSHSLIAGPTGVGKSTLLLNLMNTDLREGRGLVLIDGKGDTARALLGRIPESRRDDVVVLDCASDGPLPGLRLFAGKDADLAADVVLGVLADLFKDSWGPLSERYLRAGLLAVAQDPNGTLADVPYVFTDAAYRRRLAGRLRDPLTRSTLAGFEAMSPAERQHQLAAPLGKLGQLLGRPVVRTALGQANPQLDFAAALREQKIVVVSLAPARVGSGAARLVGALSVFALFQAVLERSELAEADRVPFPVYVDEPKSLGDLPTPLDTLFEQARGLAVGVTLAPQSMTQLPKTVRQAALTNAATRIVFRQQADDAQLLARDLAGVKAEDLQDLDAYEAVARIALGPGDVAPPVTIRTAPAPKADSDPRQLRSEAEARYGMTLEEVDAELEARHRATSEDAPIGRKRRAA